MRTIRSVLYPDIIVVGKYSVIITVVRCKEVSHAVMRLTLRPIIHNKEIPHLAVIGLICRITSCRKVSDIVVSCVIHGEVPDAVVARSVGWFVRDEEVPDDVVTKDIGWFVVREEVPDIVNVVASRVIHGQGPDSVVLKDVGRCAVCD